MEALKPSAPLIHEDRSKYKNAPKLPEGVSGHNLQSHVVWKNGDIEAGFANAARVFEHTFRTPLSHHGYIEPCACTVHVHADGRVEVWAANKGPWGLRDQMAEDFGIAKEKIKVHIIQCRRRLRRQGVAHRRAGRLPSVESDRAAGEAGFRLHRRHSRRRPPASRGDSFAYGSDGGRNFRGDQGDHPFQWRSLWRAEGESTDNGARRAAPREHVSLPGDLCRDLLRIY